MDWTSPRRTRSAELTALLQGPNTHIYPVLYLRWIHRALSSLVALKDCGDLWNRAGSIDTGTKIGQQEVQYHN